MGSDSSAERSLVYGTRQDTAEGLVFVAEDRARDLAATWAAVNGAKTWGEFRDQVPRAYEAIAEGWQENDELAPLPDEPFEAARIPGMDDGDWPGWPAQEMLTWMPDAVKRRFGRVEASVINGDFLLLPPEQTSDIVSALETFGYPCREDQGLVKQACGR